MIQQRSLLKIVDNSGAKTVRCIKVLGGFKKKTSSLGEIVIVSIQQLRNKQKKTSKVLKGGVFRALIIKTARSYKRKDGTFLSVKKKNLAVLINNKNNPIGTRILSSFPKRIRTKKLLKFSSLCSGLI